MAMAAIVASCSAQLGGRLAPRRCCTGAARQGTRRSITAAQRRAQRQRKDTKQDRSHKPLTKHRHIDKAPHMRQATPPATSSSNTSFFALLENHPLPFAGLFASVTFMIVYFTRGSSRPPVRSIVQHVPPDDAPASYAIEENPAEEAEQQQPTVRVQDEAPSEADPPESPPVDLISACGFRQHPDL
ncbi:hypothetical protein THAOC_30070 [Thalassiosira oceanica]|uniref:Uncharacterized protein n=1 Tax=Thalassiosira oceanica TaxID=159749 RepID=K0RPK3_THAOC|nr:hypothetical protein THAOC_30070 [Thalassiosira oceanica]|mmetsp:Transcript_17491/g.38805  ORF Transcript_17491/g.38805 Transcript_17491/m.38805 type:complete len:186 (-) Transcript_17491:91-648(-)|eukprot:EJK50826.1 hypothetical protein THAOC_30070 [Thalassiosira oceanica]